MKKNKNINFTCPLCKIKLSPKFIPNLAPSCPSCGSNTVPEENSLEKICSNCNEISPTYSSNKCKKCNSTLVAFSGPNSLQNHQSALYGKRTLYSTSRGPEGGTIPRWNVY